MPWILTAITLFTMFVTPSTSRSAATGHLLVAGITLQPQHFQHRLTFTTQVLDWAAERLACHHRFMTVVLFAMHENSGALVAMIGMVEEVKALVAEFLDIQTGADLRRLRGITPALQVIAVNADDDDPDEMEDAEDGEEDEMEEGDEGEGGDEVPHDDGQEMQDAEEEEEEDDI